jgi:putative membrane protein
MTAFSNLLVGLVALLHFGFLAMEMLFWKTPFVREIFDLTEAQANFTASLAANIGLYNSFPVIGSLGGLLAKREGFAIKVFFLVCALVVSVYGAIIKQSILVSQALPAAFALLLLWLENRGYEDSRAV